MLHNGEYVKLFFTSDSLTTFKYEVTETIKASKNQKTRKIHIKQGEKTFVVQLELR
jgi:hypothetical protein